MARKANITALEGYFIGTDQIFEFTIDDGTGKTPDSSSPVNITGYTFKFTVKLTDIAVDPAFIEKTSSAGIAITDGPNGVLRVTVEDVDTDSLLDDVTYRYSLKRTNAGAESILSHGDIVILKAPST